jgi:hypothetical protein
MATTLPGLPPLRMPTTPVPPMPGANFVEFQRAQAIGYEPRRARLFESQLWMLVNVTARRHELGKDLGRDRVDPRVHGGGHAG